MEIPKFHDTFIPILKVLSDNRVIGTSDLFTKVNDQFYSALPKHFLELKTKNGHSLVRNRIAWGKAYLKQAGMVEQPERGLVRITSKGQQVLKHGSLTLGELKQDADFLANRKVSGQDAITETFVTEDTPQDLIDKGIRLIESQVKGDLLSKLKAIDPFAFEKVVLQLLEKMGYGDFRETPKTGDGGIDGVISEDRLGLDKIYVQAKRYTENKVRETEIRNFIGAMSRDTNKGIFVTTSSFDEKATNKARDAQHKIILIDGKSLVDLMYSYGVGVQEQSIYTIKEIDEDFFEEK